METTTPKFDIDVKLTGRDGNAMAIIGAVTAAIKKAGATEEQCKEYFAESTASDYDHLLRTAMQWVNVL